MRNVGSKKPLANKVKCRCCACGDETWHFKGELKARRTPCLLCGGNVVQVKYAGPGGDAVPKARRSKPAIEPLSSVAKSEGHQRCQLAQNLKRVGYTSYAAYHASPLWQTLCERVYRCKGKTCDACRETLATQVYAESFSVGTLNGSDIGPLRPLCGDCFSKAQEHGPEMLPPSEWELNRRERRKRKSERKAAKQRGEKPPKREPLAPNAWSKRIKAIEAKAERERRKAADIAEAKAAGYGL